MVYKNSIRNDSLDADERQVTNTKPVDSGANSRSDVCAGHRSENVMRHERLDADKQHVTGTKVADTDRNSRSDVCAGHPRENAVRNQSALRLSAAGFPWRTVRRSCRASGQERDLKRQLRR